jgi:molybdopterin-guanine dinucleotide biosynthesis protein A
MAIQKSQIAGVLLAGGRSSRMGGGDKCLRLIGGRPIIAHLIERMAPQVGALVINANGDPERFAAFGLPVVADSVPDFAGPLAGILAGMEWASARGNDWIATAPTDTPFPPTNLVARLSRAIGDASTAIASSAGRMHPVFGIFRVTLADDLRRFLESGTRRAADWLGGQRITVVEFEIENGRDPFFNINTPADLTEAERLQSMPGR